MTENEKNNDSITAIQFTGSSVGGNMTIGSISININSDGIKEKVVSNEKESQVDKYEYEYDVLFSFWHEPYKCEEEEKIRWNKWIELFIEKLKFELADVGLDPEKCVTALHESEDLLRYKRELDYARCVILFYSPSYLKSRWSTYEYKVLVNKSNNKLENIVIPIVLLNNPLNGDNYEDMMKGLKNLRLFYKEHYATYRNNYKVNKIDKYYRDDKELQRKIKGLAVKINGMIGEFNKLKWNDEWLTQSSEIFKEVSDSIQPDYGNLTVPWLEGKLGKQDAER